MGTSALWSTLAAAGLSAVCSAGLQLRFNGAYFHRAGSFVTATDSYDKLNVPGQGEVRYDIAPPDYQVSVHLRATSGAGPGYLGTSNYSQFIKTFPGNGAFNWSLGASSFATMIFDDFVLTGPGNGIAAPLRLVFTGSMSGGSSSSDATAIVSVQIVFRVNGTSGGGTKSIQYQGLNITGGETGVLTGFSGSGVISAPPIFLPTNTPFPLEVQLQSSASTSMYYAFSGNASANTDFIHTLKFPTDRPVFDLPPGYTINSAQARIVNNFYSPPCPSDLNMDLLVDDADFVIFLGQYNILDCADTAMYPGCPADFNTDHFVDDGDFVIFLAAYNELICD